MLDLEEGDVLIPEGLKLVNKHGHFRETDFEKNKRGRTLGEFDIDYKLMREEIRLQEKY